MFITSTSTTLQVKSSYARGINMNYDICGFLKMDNWSVTTHITKEIRFDRGHSLLVTLLTISLV